MKGNTIEQVSFLIAGIAIVLFFLVTILSPWAAEMLQGECWRNVRYNTVLDIERGINDAPSYVKVTLGDCVKNLVIANKNDVDIMDYECVYGTNSFIGVKPSLKLLQILKKATISPECRDMDYFISGSPFELPGPGRNENSVTYCIYIGKSGNTLYFSKANLEDCAG